MGDEKFTLEIKLGNEDMLTRQDIAHRLRDVVEALESGDPWKFNGVIKDVNGNTCGVWEIK